MTREERLELLKLIEKDIHVCSIESTFLDDAKSCAIHSVIEELEQEPIIDKIRAEIEEYRDSMLWSGESLIKWEAINYILEQIIDKYKGRKDG